MKYISKTGIQYTFPVMTGEKLNWITFKGNENSYETDNKALQEAIEAHENFKSGKIARIESTRTTQNNKNEVVTAASVTEYPEIKTTQDAAALLAAEPYKVPAQKLRTPEAIKKQALEAGVSFPNLKIK